VPKSSLCIPIKPDEVSVGFLIPDYTLKRINILRFVSRPIPDGSVPVKKVSVMEKYSENASRS
jgi:hypothetical protein